LELPGQRLQLARQVGQELQQRRRPSLVGLTR
jgi:hypothetical protein